MHPFCGWSLQSGAKVVAIVEMMISLYHLARGVLALGFGAALTSGSKHFNGEDNIGGTTSEFDKAAPGIAQTVGTGVMIFSIIFIAISVVGLLIAILLFVGANKKNRTMCLVWFILNAIFLVLDIFSISNDWNEEFQYNIVGLGIIVFRCYSLWVVWAFMSELKQTLPVVTPYTSTKP